MEQLWALSAIIQSFTKDGYFGNFAKKEIQEVIDQICEDPDGMQKQLNMLVVEQMKMMEEAKIF